MAWSAFWLCLCYLLVAFGLRSLVQWRRTGSTGFRGVSGDPGTVEWWGGVLFGAAVLLGPLAPLPQAVGVLPAVAVLDGAAGHVAGLVLAVAGIAATWAAQQAMGRSWRIGVDPEETTELVTGGVFALVRNPIFAAMTVAAVGLTLMAPNVLALAALVALVTAVQIQVRLVEEPHLLATHAAAYRAYAGRTGRFLPWLGRLDRTVG